MQNFEFFFLLIIGKIWHSCQKSFYFFSDFNDRAL